MRNIINPTTGEFYTQDELKQAFKKNQELEYKVISDGNEYSFFVVPYREYVMEDGVQKEIYSL